MKNKVIVLAGAILCMFSIASAQTFMDYVSSMRGDTAVIKDYAEKGNEASTLASAMAADNSAPAGRVYMLKTNGFYPLAANPTTPSSRPIVIVGEDFTRLVNNKNANSAPPLISGSSVTGGTTNTGGINYSNDLTVKNCNITPCAPDGTRGWTFFWGSAPNCRVVLDNDLFERTLWVEVASNDVAGTRLFINDCYFVNLSGLACRRNGGVYDNVNNNTDTIWVENSTHVMAEGSMYKFRNFQIKKLFFNHNTFVNCAGSTFESLGYESDLTVTNNIFVNSNLQAYSDSLGVWDAGETDADMLPTGLVNCDTLPSNYTQMDRKILVDRNVAYWDPRFDDMVSTLKSRSVDGTTNWVSQAITMNTRTQAMFNDNAHYPYLTEGVWYKKLPTFTDPKDLLTSQVDSLKRFALSTVDGTSTAVLGAWRLVNTDPSLFIYSDWPIPIDLSYSDADLLAGGTGGFPVGDLNWFPAKKTQWVAQRDAEHTTLQHILDTGVLAGVQDIATTPTAFTLSQNYPNPFNPTTTISFSLPHSGNVSLRVFNVLGQEVATLVNGFTAAGSHEVQFDATNLASGVYFYELVSGDFAQVKKMTLMK
jgi:hypothetical protein